MANGCGCGPVTTDTRQERRVLTIALGLNATMFVVGLAAGVLGRSNGLVADALDMLADALAYGIALAAIQRGPVFKRRASFGSGAMLLVLGAGVLIDAARRAWSGSEPLSLVMIATAVLSLIVNATVLHLLGRYRQGEVHLRATWIFTRADVIANGAVILSGLMILLTRFRWLDPIVGAAIGLYLCKEAIEILREASGASSAAEAQAAAVHEPAHRGEPTRS